MSFFARSNPLSPVDISGSLDPVRAVTGASPAREALALISYERAAALSVLPLEIIKSPNGDVLKAAAADASSPDLIRQLRFVTDLEVRLVPAEKAVLQDAIFAAYHSDESGLVSRIDAIGRKGGGTIAEGHAVDFRATGEAEVAGLLVSLVDYAISKQASDLHIFPREEGSFVHMRVHGELMSHERPVLPAPLHRELISRIKVLAALDTTQKGRPQDGAFRLKAGARTVHVRVSVMPTVYGEKAVLRLLGTSDIMKMSELGMDAISSALLSEALSRGEGAVLFAGATGSGKTSTMYAIVNELARRNMSCSTLEDPVELIVPGVSQTSMNPRAGLDYVVGLKSVLRQDPDVILLGEIRDGDTARIALQASLSGHLLLTTVHARDVFEVFLRLSGLGADLPTIAQAASLIVHQTLVPVLCPVCKVIDLAGSARIDGEAYQPAGCRACDHTGYRGRRLLSEALRMRKEVSVAVARGRISSRDLEPLLNPECYAGRSEQLEALLKEGNISLTQFSDLSAA